MGGKELLAEAHPTRVFFINEHRGLLGEGRFELGGNPQVAGLAHQLQGGDVPQEVGCTQERALQGPLIQPAGKALGQAEPVAVV